LNTFAGCVQASSSGSVWMTWNHSLLPASFLYWPMVIQHMCYDPSKFLSPPPPLSGPSAASAAPAPLAQTHHVHPTHYTPAQPPFQPLSYGQTTNPFHDSHTFYYTTEPLDHIMEDVEPRAASPGDVDMQGPLMLKTPSPDSDGLPFHPKYLHAPGHETMSHTEFRAWLCSDPHAPPMYGSEPTSSGST
jgi:hypothetical protein